MITFGDRDQWIFTRDKKNHVRVIYESADPLNEHGVALELTEDDWQEAIRVMAADAR